MFKWFRKNKKVEIDDMVNFDRSEMFLVDREFLQEKLMPLKECFLIYCELQRDANYTKEVYGIDDDHTRIAYEKANEQKRKVLNMIEEFENK